MESLQGICNGHQAEDHECYQTGNKLIVKMML